MLFRSLPLLFAVVAIVHFVTLLNFIEPQHDDAWYVSRAWAVIHTGHAYGPLDFGVLNNYDGYWAYVWFIGSWIHSFFVSAFGADLFAVRFASFLFGLALLGIVYAIARRLFSRRVGLLAIVAGAFSLPYIYASHVGRQDIVVAVLGFGAIALYLYQNNTAFTFKSFLSGLALALTLDIHPTGIIYPPVIVALLLLDYRIAALRIGRTWGLALGFACGVLYFVAIHILPNPQTYFAISRIQQGSYVTTPPIISLNPEMLMYSFVSLVSMLDPMIFVLALCALALLLRRAGSSDIKLVVMFAALFVSFGCLVPQKPTYYAILVAPLLWLLLAAGADSLLPKEGWRASRQARMRTFLVVQLLVVLALVNVPMLIRDRYGDYQAALQLVEQNVPPGKSIIGQQTYWLARPDQPYFAWEQFAFYRRYYPGTTVDNAFAGLHPDYVIMDGLTDTFLSDDPGMMFHNVIVPQKGFLAFIASHATLVAQAKNDTYGNIRIYRINW